MDKTELETKFEEYRKYLHQEVERLAKYVKLYRRLHDRRADRLNEMNMSPAFFQTVIDALFSVIILWVDNLFSKKSERGLIDFLMFCEYNSNNLKSRNFSDGGIIQTHIGCSTEDQSRLKLFKRIGS